MLNDQFMLSRVAVPTCSYFKQPKPELPNRPSMAVGFTAMDDTDKVTLPGPFLSFVGRFICIVHEEEKTLLLCAHRGDV